MISYIVSFKILWIKQSGKLREYVQAEDISGAMMTVIMQKAILEKPHTAKQL